MRFDVTGSVTGDTQMTSGAVAPEHRPSGPPILQGPAHIEPPAARPTGSIYLSATSGVLRGSAGGSTAITRTRGRITWMVG